MLKNSYAIWIITLYSCTAYFSIGHLHPDEYYQILEFAAYKLNISTANGLTWEFYSQARSAFQPWIVVNLYKLLQYITITNPFIVTFITRLISAALSIFSCILFIYVFKDQLNSKTKQKWFILLSLFSWIAIFNSVRFSSENFSGKLFLIGFSLIFIQKYNKSFWLNLLIGGLFGLAFISRFQVGFMIIGIMAWLIIIKKIEIESFLVIVLGLCLAILLGVTIDEWFYGNWVFTAWNYFEVNLLQGRAASFGKEPWYFYLTIAGMLPYGLLYIIASVLFIYYQPKHSISWVMLPFTLIHLIISHKELRFFIPLLSFMPFVILSTLQTIQNKYTFKFGNKLNKLNIICWRLNCFLVLIICFFPSAMQIRINELLYNRYSQPTTFSYLTEGGNVLDFYKHLNLHPLAITEPSQLKCENNQNCLIALTCQETFKYGIPKGKLIFSDCPSWIFKLDFNGWLERTALYNIYELQNIESK